MKPSLSGPFVLPVRDIVRKPGEMREHTLSIPTPERWGEGIVSVSKDRELELEVRLESVHEGILVSGTVDTVFEGECGRCLRDISEPLEVEFQELFEYSREEAADFEVQDDHVDLETLIRDATVLSLPFQPVCQPDCPGLDAVTGEPLAENAGEKPDPIDPRWAGLQEFAEQFGSAPAGADPRKEES
ncbi:COG1399 protein, clustered with ribosomal protein L32p [Frigoribacterium sp. JB110]|nr:COG1399 protein, clustered with ribosomal protein L32p [Frigoribacterium sp. JB110]